MKSSKILEKNNDSVITIFRQDESCAATSMQTVIDISLSKNGNMMVRFCKDKKNTSVTINDEKLQYLFVAINSLL